MRSLLTLVLAFIIFCSSPVIMAKDNIPEGNTITVKELHKILKEKPDNFLLVDVRTPGEFSDEHLKGALNINFFGPRFEEDIQKLPKDKNIVVYCKTGRRSESAMEAMQEAGFKNVSTLKGGITAWKKADYATEHEKAPSPNP